MASRALAAAVAGRRVAGQSMFSAVASSRRGGDSSVRSAHTQAEERSADHDAPAAEGITAAQVEAALNSKNVEEVVQEVGRAATVLPDEVVHDDADAAWVPDHDTGVFVPAEEAAGNSSANDVHVGSVLDQTVFNREEEMEDVERPAVDMDNGDANK